VHCFVCIVVVVVLYAFGVGVHVADNPFVDITAVVVTSVCVLNTGISVYILVILSLVLLPMLYI